MPLRSIITLPDSRLRQTARQVVSFDGTLSRLIRDLVDTMRAGTGGVGLAAPQIGECLRVVVVDCSRSRRPCPNHGLLYLINPEIDSACGGEVLGREGCLSVPDWVAMVPRARDVSVAFQDIEGHRHQISATGFEARVIQHEIDHLNGKLFFDRVLTIHDLVRRMETPP